MGSKSITVDWIFGQAFATLTGDEGLGTANVAAADGNAIVSTTVLIQSDEPVGPDDLTDPDDNTPDEIEASAATIEMQKTGLPINYLIIAILMVITGLLVPKRK